MSTSPKKIGIIIGSTRPGRIGPQVAEYVKNILDKDTSEGVKPELSLVDIVEFKLPTFDEAILPAMVPAQGQFAHEHSKKWNAEIAKYDGYVFVTAEWNFSLPGATKNAIDYLYNSWIGKPVFIVSYGIKGGVNASEALKGVLEGMHLHVVETRTALEFPGADPANHNMSPTLMAAFGGKLADPAKEAWVKEEGSILKGYGELKSRLVSAPPSAAPVSA